MPLLDLPNELLICVADHLGGDPDRRDAEADLNAFTRTNHRLYDLLLPVLYRYIIEHVGSQALLWASEHGNTKRIERLLEAGADIEINSCHYPSSRYAYATPLYLAVANGHLDAVRLLLDKCANANTGDNKESKYDYPGSPLYKAVDNGHDQIAELLLNMGAIAEDADCGRYPTLLMAASAKGNEYIVRLLLDAGAHVIHDDVVRGYPLLSATRGGFEQLVKLLLERKAHDEMELNDSLLEAAVRGFNRIATILLDNGAKLNVHNKHPWHDGKFPWYDNALQAASAQGHAHTVKMLLAAGADVNIQGGEYPHPLQAASHEGHEHIVRLLLDAGANININCTDYQYGTPLDFAACRSSEPSITLLLDNGANGDLDHALYNVAERGYERAVKMILERGANPNALIETRTPYYLHSYGTALQAASAHGYEQVVKLLLDAGADPNVQAAYVVRGDYGSPLHAASFHGHRQVVERLLDAGADIHAKVEFYGPAVVFRYRDEVKKACGNALKAALAMDQKDVVELLRARGAVLGDSA